jgi:hypothetical protein
MPDKLPGKAIESGTITSTQLSTSIFESGSNENGSYIKFPDGTLIQHMQVGITPVANQVTTATKNWPIPFVGNVPAVATNPNSTVFGAANTLQLLHVASVGLETYDVRVFRTNTTNSVIGIIATGRWY